jgi:hypothetical protein
MNYIPAYNFDLLPVLLSIIFISVVVLWVAIKNHQNFLLMVILIPLTIASGWTIYTTVDSLLGYPVFDSIEQDSLYVTHLEDPMGEFIYIWLVKPGELRPKSIMIENSEKNKKELNEAQKASEEGKPQQLRQAEKGELDGQGETNGGELQSYDFQNEGFQILKDEQFEQEKQEPQLLPGKVGEFKPTPNAPRQLEYQPYETVVRPNNDGNFRVSDHHFLGGK